MRPTVATLLLLALLVAVCRAGAQTIETSPLAPVRQWDISAGIGVRFFDAPDLGDTSSNWNAAWQPRVQVGRYLTPHLKAEVAVSSPLTYEFYLDEPVVVPEVPTPIRAFAEHRTRVFSVTPLVTYQFFENLYAHPFVSAGVDVGIVDERVTRLQQTRRLGSQTYTLPADSRSRSVTLLRPLVAAGFKSYLNDWVFVRPEGSLAFKRSGTTQFNLRLDIGVDF
jgi:hypothetical protein